MEAEDPLSQLRDIHLPEAVTFWPPAPGWWVLLALIIVGLVFLWRHAIAAMIRRRKLASVLEELERTYGKFNETAAFDNKRNQAGLDYLATVNVLLKRVALVIYPEAGIAQMSGAQWLKFLDSCDETTEFSQGAGTPLADGLYRRDFDADADALHTLVKTWIESRYQEQASPGLLQGVGRTAA